MNISKNESKNVMNNKDIFKKYFGDAPEVSKLVRMSLYDNNGRVIENVLPDSEGSADIIEANGNMVQFSVNAAAYGIEFQISLDFNDNGLIVFIDRHQIFEKGDYKIKNLEVMPFLGSADEGDEGYFVIPQKSGIICNFKNKKESRLRLKVYNNNQCNMPVFGIVKKDYYIVGIIEGGRFDASIALHTATGNDKKYCTYPVIHIRDYNDEEIICEDITVRYYFVKKPESSYVDVAKTYRNYQIENGAIIPLKERVKNNKVLQYAVHALPIRIRMGWKPAPPPVLEQTPENEPEMHVACTFAKVKEIISKLKEAGIEKAEICLVGWNCKGHDGRYPQIFPVEEKLGGQKELEDLIRFTQAKGYQIVVHDNYIDAYKVSELWDENTIAINHDGKLNAGGPWSGGQSYKICGEAAYSIYARKHLPAIRELGFEGIHYTDVLTIVDLYKCYSEKHPMSRKENAKWRNEILSLIRETFGGAASEGPLDFAAGYLDRIMYLLFENKTDALLDYDYVDKIIPFWPIVYHGSIVYNLSNQSVNCMIKDKKVLLRSAEYGATPAVYFYSRFKSDPGGNWMGENDITYNNDEDGIRSIQKIKQLYDTFRGIINLQEEFIEDHKEIEDGVFMTKYSNGVTTIVNYKDETVKFV